MTLYQSLTFLFKCGNSNKSTIRLNTHLICNKLKYHMYISNWVLTRLFCVDCEERKKLSEFLP